MCRPLRPRSTATVANNRGYTAYRLVVDGGKRGAGSAVDEGGEGGRCCKVFSMTLEISISSLSPTSFIRMV